MVVFISQNSYAGVATGKGPLGLSNKRVFAPVTAADPQWLKDLRRDGVRACWACWDAS